VARGWLLLSCFFVIAATAGCYNDNTAFISTSSDMVLLETFIGFWFLWKQSPGLFLLLLSKIET